MSSQSPIQFHDLVAHKGQNAPLFSPNTIRARLAFAVKGIPIETVETTYHDLRFTWTDKLGVEKATVPFIRKPDGTYLMESAAIIDWLEDTYPDRPSVYLPEAEPPIDLASPAYKKARVDDGVEELTEWLSPYKPSLMRIYAPAIMATYSKEDHEYWSSDERMGEKDKYKKICAQDEEACFQTIHDNLATLAADLAAKKWLFFQSATKPGLRDFWLFAPHRQLYGTVRANGKRVYEDGPLGEWTQRMVDHFAEALGPVLERDPK